MANLGKASCVGQNIRYKQKALNLPSAQLTSVREMSPEVARKLGSHQNEFLKSSVLRLSCFETLAG